MIGTRKPPRLISACSAGKILRKARSPVAPKNTNASALFIAGMIAGVPLFVRVADFAVVEVRAVRLDRHDRIVLGFFDRAFVHVVIARGAGGLAVGPPCQLA